MYQRDKDFSRPLSVRPNGQLIKKCVKCKEEFMTTGNSIICEQCSIREGDK